VNIKVRFSAEIEFNNDSGIQFSDIKRAVSSMKLTSNLEFPITYTEPNVKVLRLGDIFIDDTYQSKRR
jgi:hypothetical protein